MYSLYVLLLENKRIYVGITPTWRSSLRFDEHTEGIATKWTGKHPVISKVLEFSLEDKKLALATEHRLTELLMERYGLDSTRGGNFVMAREGGTWWVPKEMKNTPRFTETWTSLSEHTFSESLPNDPILLREHRISQCFADSK